MSGARLRELDDTLHPWGPAGVLPTYPPSPYDDPAPTGEAWAIWCAYKTDTPREDET